MTSDPGVVAARARATAARERFEETLGELQSRLTPSAIMHNAWAGVVDRSTDTWDAVMDRSGEALGVAVDRGTQVTDEAVAFVRKRPGVSAAAVATAVALLLGPTLVKRALRAPPPPPPAPNDPPRLTGPIPHLETRP